jgi:hypothetical protein
MGIGEMVGMRWILWDGGEGEVPDEVLDEMMRFIRRGLGTGIGEQRIPAMDDRQAQEDRT